MKAGYITEKEAHPWVFEPCDPEGMKNQYDIEYTHAARGRRPVNGVPVVVNGYGFTQDRADYEAQRAADVHDSYQVLHTPIWPVPV